MAIRVPPGGSSLGSFLFTTSALAFGGPRSQIFNGWAPDAPSGLDIDFTTGVLDPRITFARASAATYYNSSGLIASAASGAPRFDYDPVTLAPRGLLLEEQRTNYLTASENFAASVWNNASIGLTTEFRTAPDGTMTADQATGLVAHTIGVHDGGTLLYNPTAVATFNAAAQTVTGSVWMYSTTSATVELNVYEYGGGMNYSGAKVIPANIWTRLTHTATVSSSGNPVGFIIYVGNQLVSLWGAQLEIGAFATSYIPTTSVAVVRAADTASMTGANFSSWYNQTVGTFVIDVIPNIETGSWVAPNDNSNNNRLVISGLSTQDVGFAIVNGGGVQMNTSSINLYTPFILGKAGFAYKLDDCAGCLNGGTIIPDPGFVTPPTTLTQLDFGRGSPTANPATQLWISRFQYFNTRKTDTELQALTAPSVTGSGTLVAQAAVAASTTGISGSTTSTAPDTTWSTTDKSASVTLSNGNLTAASPGSGADCGVRSTQSQPAGKFYFEAVWTGSGGADTGIGIATSTAVLSSVGSVAANAAAVFQLTGGIWFNGSNTGLAVGAVAAGAVLCFAIDLINQKFWARKDAGNWNGTAGNDPATNTGGVNIAALFPTNPVFALACFSSTVPAATINFGATAFAQATPSGFSSWKALSAGGLVAQAAVLSSTTGVSGSTITDTTLNAGSAVLSSITGISGATITDTSLNASPAVVSSTTGLVRAIANPSVLTAQAATLIGLGTGAGAATIGAGALSSRPATLASTGLALTIGSGALVDGSAVLSALAVSGSTGTGKLDATAADLDSLGYVEQGGVSIMVNGEWQRTTPYVRTGGVWRPATAWANVSGTWKRVA